MIPTAETYIRIAVEGASDEEMARKLMRHAGLTVAYVLVKKDSGGPPRCVAAIPPRPWRRSATSRCL